MTRRRTGLSDDAMEALGRLARAWELEHHEEEARDRVERERLALRDRVACGMAVDRLSVDEIDGAAGGRWRVRLVAPRPVEADSLRFGPGRPVELVRDDSPSVRGVLASIRDGAVDVVLDGDLPDDIGVGTWRLEPTLPRVTFERGRDAVARLIGAAQAPPALALAQRLYGTNESPSVGAGGVAAMPGTFFDDALEADQRDAVRCALREPLLALVHGPPGTGKTRTLVEIVRQMVARGQRVLVVAASNAAVDLLTERLGSAGAPVLRVGHPARIDPELEPYVLDVRLQRSDAAQQARAWNREASALRRRARSADRRTARDLFTQARSLQRDAQRYLARVQRAMVEQAPVVLTTAAGAGTSLLATDATDRPPFDCVVIDEATQLVDPLAWIAIGLASRVVLAGDPMQLAPVVCSAQAERLGLGQTLFERGMEPSRGVPSVMLRVQHRMSEALQEFPSQASYGGRLVAAPAVAGRCLDDLGALPDPLRASPIVFLDTAGRGWDAEQVPGDASWFNVGNADRIVAEVERILSRGVAPSSITVIAAYDAQVRLLRERLAAHRAVGLGVGTVDAFQGQENDVVIVDLVRNDASDGLGFLADTRRMNVAITRPRRALWVIGDSGLIGTHDWYAAFLERAEAVGGWVSVWTDEAPRLDDGPT
jgi:ATP-dependent RNA/DNA helicase IGHMBP2